MTRVILLAVAVCATDLSLALDRVSADLTRSYPASLARQGVAVDGVAFFAVANTGIARHARRGGRELARWQSVGRPGVQHLNSCLITSADELMCINSNFPALPMAGSLEWFDPSTLTPIRSRSLGSTDGSPVWVDELADGWIAGFAHYDDRGGVPGKDHRYTRVVRYDRYWVEREAWLLPSTVLERMRPYSASGGSVGPDGLLYLTGHDRPELYALALPPQGPTLVHVATIAIDAAGQAFAWDRFSDNRILWAIDRPSREVRVFRVPRITPPAGSRFLPPPSRREPSR